MRYFKNKKSLIDFLSQESTRTPRACTRISECERSDNSLIFLFFSFLFSSPFVLYCFVFLCLVLSCIVLSCKAEIFKQYVYIIFHKFQIKYSSHCIEYSPAIIDSHIFRCPFWHQNHWYAVCIFEPPSIGKYFVFLHFHVSVVTRCVTIVQDRVNSVSFRNPMKHSATAACTNWFKARSKPIK